MFVVDQLGKVWAIKIQPGVDVVPDRLMFLDVGVDRLGLSVPLGAFGPGTFDERGLLGLAFHPEYRKNGHRSGGARQIHRWSAIRLPG